MPSIYDSVTEQLSGSNLTQLSQQIGADEATTSQAVQAALPMLLGGLARNASRPDGAASLGDALTEHRGTGAMQNLGGLLGNAESGKGAGILGHIFGGKRETVENGVGQATGLKQQQVGKLLMVLAPIVMAALARRQQAHQDQEVPVPGASTIPGGPAGLPDILQREAQEAQQRAPSGLGGLMGMLDRDGDGNPLNDLGRMLGGR
jgi:hypothetical protein